MKRHKPCEISYYTGRAENAFPRIRINLLQNIRKEFGNSLYTGTQTPGMPVGTEQLKAFGNYCKFVAKEFCGKVKYFEIWNEPNHEIFNPGGASAADYVQVMKTAYNAVKSVNKDAYILGISEDGARPEYTKAVLNAGGGAYMDAVSLHPYSCWYGGVFDESSLTLEQMITNNKKVIMDAGLNLPIWITEVGYMTSTGRYTYEQQGAYNVRTAIEFKSDDRIDKIFFYELHDSGLDASSTEANFGMLEYDGTPKAAHSMLLNANNILANADFVKKWQGNSYYALYEFRDRVTDEDIFVLWTKKGKKRQIQLSANANQVSSSCGGDNAKVLIDLSKANSGKEIACYDAYGAVSSLLKAYTDDESFYVKAFTQAGSVEKFKAAEKFKIDGETCRGSDAAESLDEVIRLLKEKVAVIEFNNAGEIKSIDTPEGKGKLRLDVPSARNSWLNSSSKLGKKLMIDDGTVIITIPKDFQTANEEEFGIISKKNLKHWGSYLAESYKVSDDDSYADLVVMRDYSKFIASSEDVPLVVSSVSEGVNPDNEVVTQIEGYIGNALMTYMCDSGYMPENINVGDILSISTNSKGMVTKADKIAGADSAVGESTSYLADNSRVVAGFVNSVDGKIVKVSMQDGSTVDEYFDMSTPVIVCTPGKKIPVEVGSGADIKAFTHYGAKCSKIVVRTYQQIQKVMVIYNNQ